MSILDKWPLGKAVTTVRDSLAAGLSSGPSASSVQSSSTDPALRNRDYAVIIQQAQEVPVGRPKIIVGSMPESLQIEQSSEFDVPWGAGLAGDGMIGNLVAVTTGNRLVGQVMTMKVWQGAGNDFSFTVAFELRTWSDPARDVIQPLRDLLSLTLPSIDSTGFLRSPGPILDPEGVKKVAGQVTNTVINTTKLVADQTSRLAGTSTIDGIGQAVTTYVGDVNKAIGQSGLMRKQTIESHVKNKISIQIGRWFSLNNVLVTNVQHDIKPQTPHRGSGLFQTASVVVTFTPMFALTTEDIDTLLATSALAPAQQLASNTTKRDPRDAVRGSRGF